MAKKDITNIIDYLVWRSDLSFEVDHLNEVDALIFSRFSYMDMKGILDDDHKSMTIKEAYDIYRANEDERPKYAIQDPELFKLMAESTRFKDLKISYHEFLYDTEDVEQFSAVTISIPNIGHFLSFRGTDDTINGWKEDLLMTFDEQVPSQLDALRYVADVAAKLDGDLFLGGHSKGGNLAVYAALFCNDEIAKRIKGVFSFDGPGLHKSVSEKIDDKIALPVIATYMPQSSIFGKMLTHRELQVVVNSNASGVMQHDIYTWEVVRKDFVLTKEDTATSRIFDQAFHDYLSDLSKSDRKEVVDIIFDAIGECDAKTLEEFSKNLAGNMIKVLKHMSDLDEHEGKLVKDAISILGDSIKEGVISEITSHIPFLNKKDEEEK